MRALILPPTSLFLLAAIGWLLHRWWPRLGRFLIVSSLAALLFVSTGIGAALLLLPLENMTTPLVSTKGTRAQAIVVLASGRDERAAEYGNKDIPDYVALARLRYAAKLQHETGLPILVSGGNVLPYGDGASKADAMAAALREDFVTPVKWVEGKSENTAENAQFSASMLRQDGINRILLVTDAMHMPRARQAFARAGLDVVEAPTMFFGTGSIGLQHFVPSPEGLRRSHNAIYEWVGLFWYWTRQGR